MATVIAPAMGLAAAASTAATQVMDMVMGTGMDMGYMHPRRILQRWAQQPDWMQCQSCPMAAAALREVAAATTATALPATPTAGNLPAVEAPIGMAETAGMGHLRVHPWVQLRRPQRATAATTTAPPAPPLF